MAEYYRAINAAFQSNPNIDEIGLLMDSSNDCVQLVGNKLGLFVLGIKPLFKYSVQEFDSIAKKLADNQSSLHIYVDEIIHLTRAILIVRADIPYILNYRKILIRNGYIDARAEIWFMHLMLRKHPKATSAWNHVRWCFVNQLKASIPESTASFLDEELQICCEMSDSYPKNYFAWQHLLIGAEPWATY